MKKLINKAWAKWHHWLAKKHPFGTMAWYNHTEKTLQHTYRSW